MCSVIYHHQTSIRSWLQMNSYALSFLKVLSSEEIPHGIYIQAQFIGNPMHASIRQ